MATLSTCLWFDDQAEEAARFYTSVFPNSHVVGGAPYAAETPSGKEVGSVMTVDFELDGRPFTALNGGPQFSFTEAVSLVVRTRGQEETDRYWDALLADGGEPSMCGWLKDRFGLSWQIVPEELDALLGDPDPERARRAMQVMLTQRRIDIAEIRRAID
ncbi:VOC family protein [Ornithinimicrobium cerasi]|uniref:Glyoxalase superfamily enzyme, possibly 3-demethylubiquinone-9 3-methyltransferase n=1 Tax=Ornithinimicrobium cerasi TaxID=2248773 RepID=A0A285VJT5_9MICO|nr:VOC family protein [Ornithinimicrobium cerasi]SOC54329.1 Glyoxalase superfamily enzyme, possibly 3-demethylubiquinone-9 3-methyltransferase [Ornithinimicrobium cerasi]